MSQIKKKGLFWARNALLRFPKHGGIIFWGLYFNIASKKIISSHKKKQVQLHEKTAINGYLFMPFCQKQLKSHSLNTAHDRKILSIRKN